LFSTYIFGQVEENSEIFQQLKANDSLLFNVGFNHCNTDPFLKLLNEDFEFYHDKGGITTSKTEFISNFKTGLCKSPSTYQSRRELIEGSLEVFELKNNNVVYGAIQKGIHKFYEKQVGKDETSGSTARFTHLWLLVNNEWKLSRSLSYDHLMPKH
jgi:hypothetical protein